MTDVKQHNKLAIVTGGTRGIGRAISQVLQKNQYKVIANFCGNEKAAELFNQQTGIEIKKWNVGDFQQCKEAIAQIKQEYGNVAVLVNNAGVTKDATLHRMDKQKWDDTINVNLNSMFNMTRPIIEDMRNDGYGRIVNITSINAQKGQFGQTNYCASKAGIIGFTKALALESARKGITVNCIAPGYIETDMTAIMDQKTLASVVATIPKARLGYAKEIAACVAYLTGENSGFITGQTIAVNGAQYIS